MKALFLIARTVGIEALRRKEIYVVVLLSCVLIALIMTLDFFQLDGLTKFYREFALKVMSTATAITVIILSSRQLPREFERRTIYPLLSRPISRPMFLLGKLLGVWLSAAFCFGLFMLVFIGGMIWLQGDIHWPLFFQYLYLQMMMMLILASLGFMLSMMFNIDAAISLAILLFGLGSTLASIITHLYEATSALGQWFLKFLTYVIPQLMLFDLSEKAIHSEAWEPLSMSILGTLTLYAGVFSGLYFFATFLLFRRKAL